MTKVFFVTKICTEVKYYDEISQKRHKSMTLICGYITSQQFSGSDMVIYQESSVVLELHKQDPHVPAHHKSGRIREDSHIVFPTNPEASPYPS
jgi:hypothetical protein